MVYEISYIFFFGNILNFTFKMLFDIYFLILKNSIRAHVRYRGFATLHIELYRVVDYDSKWSTKFRMDSMLEFFKFHF